MMDVRNIFKVALAVLILPVGLDSYANGRGSTSCITGYGAYMNADNYGYSSGQNNQHNDSNCRNYRNYKNGVNTKGINHGGGKPKSSNKSVVNEVVVKGHNYSPNKSTIPKEHLIYPAVPARVYSKGSRSRGGQPSKKSSNPTTPQQCVDNC